MNQTPESHLSQIAAGMREATSRAQPLADLDAMVMWAQGVMVQRPDFIIGENYLRRWWVVPRNPLCNVYLHEINKSDDDRAFHDHPWDNRTLILHGGYIEHTPAGSIVRKAGDVIDRTAESLHRLEVIPGQRAITLFMTGPAVREWGFACPQGWVHWRDFTNPEDTGQVGRGCGELVPAPPAQEEPA